MKKPKCLLCDRPKDKVIYPIPPSLLDGYLSGWNHTNGSACLEHFEELREMQIKEGVFHEGH